MRAIHIMRREGTTLIFALRLKFSMHSGSIYEHRMNKNTSAGPFATDFKPDFEYDCFAVVP